MRPKGELNHWSHERIERIDPDQKYPLAQEWKPSGFWFDVDREWYRFCKEADFRENGLAFRHRITVAGDARIVRLADVPSMLSFTKEYAVPHPVLGAWSAGRALFGPWHDHCIDWPRVAETHQGIIITPYCWQLRMELMWYYGWDCASGCVWEPSVLSIDAVYSKGRKIK